MLQFSKVFKKHRFLDRKFKGRVFKATFFAQNNLAITISYLDTIDGYF